MASTTQYTTTEGRKRLKNTYHVACEARRASRMAPIGFDDEPPAGYAIPEPKARTKSRRSRKAGTRKSRYMRAARYEAQTWIGPKGQAKHLIVDVGENALVCVHATERAARLGAKALNREYRKRVQSARKAA